MAYWNDVIAEYGSGAVDFRLVIEGAPTSFVTSLSMRGTEASGRRRVTGLDPTSLGFEETAYLAGAELKISFDALLINETPEPDLNAATALFSALPSVVAYLDPTNSLTVGETSAVVLNSNNLALNGYYYIGTETIKVTGIAGTTLTVSRAQYGSIEQSHNVVNATSAEARSIPIYDAIHVFAKRRWWLYAHGKDELTTADNGTLVMQGIITGEPEESGGQWSLSLGSRWELLEQEVGGGTDQPRRLRGIYYPGQAPLYFDVSRLSGANWSDSLDTSIRFVFSGFWETQDDFCTALTTALNNHASIGTWATWQARVVDDRWELFFRTPSASQRFIVVTGGTVVDGIFNGTVLINSSSGTHGAVDAATVRAVLASTEYLVPWFAGVDSTFGVATSPLSEARRVPRTLNSPTFVRDTDAQITSYPIGRQYLDSVTGIVVGSALSFPATAAWPSPAGEDATVAIHVQSVSTATGSIVAYLAGATLDTPSRLRVAGAGCPELTVSRSYAEAGADLAGFRQALVDVAPAEANDGTSPWVTDDDLAEWGTVVSEATAGKPYLQRRFYVFYQGQRCEDVIKEECKLLGVFPYLDASFKVALRHLTIDTDEIATGFHATGRTLIDDERRVEVRGAADGHINYIEIQRGYDEIEDKYTLAPIHVRDNGAIALAKARRVLEIRPKTRAVGEEISEEEAALLYPQGPLLTLFGGKIVHLVVDVPWTFWDILIGDSILITDPAAPYDGARGLHTPGSGLTSARATVVGRRWSFSDAAGTFTCLVTGLNTAGYTPTGRVASASGATTSWTVTLTAARYAPTGANDDTYFAVNDRVRLVEWDATSPTVRTGVITSINLTTHEIGLTLDTSWAGLGGATYNLIYAPSTDASLTTAQRTLPFVAGATAIIDDGGDGVMAKVFAP